MVAAEARRALPVFGALLIASSSLALLAAAFIVSPRALGDAGEYLLMAESFVRHRTPELRPGDAEALSRAALAHPIAGGMAPPFRVYYPDRRGRLYSAHFWAYPLVVSPLLWVLGRIGADELRAFQIANAILLAGALWVVVLVSPLVWRQRLSMALLLLVSPTAWFVFFPHPEVFCASLLVAALALHHRGDEATAIALAAAASLQNPPIFVLASCWYAATWIRRRTIPSVMRATAAWLIGWLSPIFFLFHFETPSLIAREAARSGNLSLRKTAELFYDFNLGLLPFVPVVIVGSAIAIVLAVLRRDGRCGWVLERLLVVSAMAFATTSTDNWNHGTCGPSRYGVWLLPLIVDLFVRLVVPGDGEVPRGLWRLAMAAALATQMAAFYGRPLREDHLEHSRLARLVLDRWPQLYSPSPEIFAERTAHEDPAGPGPFVYSSGGRCRKALAQRRHAAMLQERCGAAPPSYVRWCQEVLEANDRQRWTYVDYR